MDVKDLLQYLSFYGELLPHNEFLFSGKSISTKNKNEECWGGKARV